jgi:hypothetical protein
MTPKEYRYTFLAGVAVALLGTLILELNPHQIITVTWRSFRPLLASSLLLFCISTVALYRAAAAASAATQQRVELNFDRSANEFDRDHHVDVFGYGGLLALVLGIAALVADKWIHSSV